MLDRNGLWCSILGAMVWHKKGMAMFVGPQDVLDMRSMNII